MTWAEAILEYHFALEANLTLPDRVEWLYPYSDPETRRCMCAFYHKYYGDHAPRALILGINPGRFGAGVTGVPFTDPVRLETVCEIDNTFKKRQELSSVLVYEIIEEFGGPEAFYRQFYITSISPLGFLKDGKNYNFYDSRELQEAVRPLIIDNLDALRRFGARTETVICMGIGKNFTYLDKLNTELGLFGNIVPLPHPRWIMQYRLKEKEVHLDRYVEVLRTVADR